MMASDYPLAFHHKKGEYTCRGFFVVRWRFFLYVGACGAIRLYLGASSCTYFLALDVLFLGYT